jgi:hypothetical protein
MFQTIGDAFLKCIGEWQGTITSHNSVTEDYIKCALNAGGRGIYRQLWRKESGEYTRTSEKVDKNTMKISGVITMPDG